MLCLREGNKATQKVWCALVRDAQALRGQCVHSTMGCMYSVALLGAILHMADVAVSPSACPAETAGFLCTPLTQLQQPYGLGETEAGTGRAWALRSASEKDAEFVWIFLNGRNPQHVPDRTLTEPRFVYDRLLLQWQAVRALPPGWLLLPQASAVRGKETPNSLFPLMDWLQEVEHRLTLTHNRGLTSSEKPLVLMAHSGGGAVLTQSLAENLPTRLRAAVWFDGINGPQESQQLAQVLTGNLQGQGGQLAACQQQERCIQECLRTSPWFLWYHSSASAYEQRHQSVHRLLQRQFASLHTKHPLVPSWAWQALRAHYAVTPVEGVSHSDLMREGWVQHALQAVFAPNDLQAAREHAKPM